MDSFSKLRHVVVLSVISLQLPGAEEAIRRNPILYTDNVGEENLGIKESVAGLTLIDNEIGMRMYMRSSAHFITECDV